LRRQIAANELLRRQYRDGAVELCAGVRDER
jgi:hypothetical protein